MARRDQSNARKLELLNELTKHRLHIKVKKRALVQQLALSSERIKESINIPKILGNKIKSSIKSSPTNWFIGSTIGGLIISKIFFGSIGSKLKNTSADDKKVTSSLFFKLLVTTVRPLIKSYLMGKAQRFIAQRFSDQQVDDCQDDYPQYSNYDNR